MKQMKTNAEQRQLVELRDTHLSQTQLNNQQRIMAGKLQDKKTSLN